MGKFLSYSLKIVLSLEVTFRVNALFYDDEIENLDTTSEDQESVKDYSNTYVISLKHLASTDSEKYFVERTTSARQCFN